MIEQSREEGGHAWRRIVGLGRMMDEGVGIVHVAAVAGADDVDDGRGTVKGPTAESRASGRDRG